MQHEQRVTVATATRIDPTNESGQALFTTPSVLPLSDEFPWAREWRDRPWAVAAEAQGLPDVVMGACPG